MLILLDSSGLPYSSSYINAYFLRLNVPSYYYQIANVQGNFSLMTLPILASPSGVPQLYTAEAMYFQTVFKKPILAGFTSRENSSQQYSRLNMPLSIQAASLNAGGIFAFVSPIKENYSNLTLFFLSRYHTRYISVINQAFNSTDVFILDNYLNSFFGPPVYSGNSTSIWAVNSTVQGEENRSVVAYISLGNWTLGCQGLGPIFCSPQLNELYYGPNVRAINVSVPGNKTNLTMTFSAASLNSNVTLYLFLTSDKHELGAARLSRNVTNYELNLTLNPGISALFFVAPNLTSATFNQTFDFGIDNITFRAR